jgi:hypothetical protein
MPQLLVNVRQVLMWQQFSSFRRPRSQHDHDALTKKLVVSVLLGDARPWDNPDFVAFKEGFNITLNNNSRLFSVRRLLPSLA